MLLATRLARVTALVMLAAATAGCIVLPYGGGHRHHRGGGYHLTVESQQAAPVYESTDRHRRGRGR
jgi:hypothetical protein